MPLKIIVIGAGIAGLTAAVALRRGGHDVTVLEKSRFAAEVGAAVSLAPNGSRVLATLGFDFAAARATPMLRWELLDGATLKDVGAGPVPTDADRFGYPLYSVHRVDFHNELLRLANKDVSDGERVPRTSSRVARVDADAGIVELESGEKLRADLVVAADGVHSVARAIVAPDPAANKAESGLTSLRFLIPTDKVRAIPGVAEYQDRKMDFASVIVDKSVPEEEDQHMVWYSCRGGDVQNFNALSSIYRGPLLTDPEACQRELGSWLPKFHPVLQSIFENAKDVKMWPLIQRPPLQSWSKGKLVLIGDAAHPMYPVGGQGANQSIEDGGALGRLLAGIGPDQLAEHLKLFEQVRIKPATRTQILSSVRSNRESLVADRIEKLKDGPETIVPRCLADRLDHDCGNDVIAKCDAVLARANGGS